MDVEENIEKMKELQTIILDLLDCDDIERIDDELKHISSLCLQFQQDRHKLKSILYLIDKIAKNHHRCFNFNDKIFQVLLLFKTQIKQTFSNDEIFEIFKSNNRILLFLIEEGLFQIDESIALKMTNKNSKYKFSEYFWPELKTYIEKATDEIVPEIPDDFDEKRRIGENDSYICKLIRKDLIEDFVSFVNQSNSNLEAVIDISPYETNRFLMKKKPTLIEYAAFFGSIQILKYLFMNRVKLTASLWLYAIHGSNSEIIHFLEEQKVRPSDRTYNECIKESIKCHHNDIAAYFNDYISNDFDLWVSQQYFNGNIKQYSFHYYNYAFFPNDINEKNNFYYACNYDYYDIVEYFVNENNIDINEKMILNVMFLLMQFKNN